MMLFWNQLHAARKQNRYEQEKEAGKGSKQPSTFCNDKFHVGIISSSNHRQEKNVHLRPLLSYMCRHLEVGWHALIRLITAHLISCCFTFRVCLRRLVKRLCSALGFISCIKATLIMILRIPCYIFAGL